MAAILIANCTVTQFNLGAANLYKIVTPATADDGDTVDISSVTSEVYSGRCLAATDGNLPIATITAAGVATIPGATDDEARTLFIIGK
jgi:hypothetical protein